MGQNIGIDFGTTNCVVGRTTLGGTPSPRGPIPSTMAWHNGEYYFGRQASELLRSAEKGVVPIREVKRILGTADIKIGRHQISAVAAAARLISHLVEGYGGAEEIDAAVIATPIKTSLLQREALREAAREAGLENVRLVYEPTAALIGVERDTSLSGYHQVLVVDWGGGTLDLSIVKVEDGAFREIAVGGDNFNLGGGKIDAEITRRLLAENRDVAAIVDKIDGGIDRLISRVEMEKIEIINDLDGEDGESRFITMAWMPNQVLVLEPKVVYDVLRVYTEKAKNLIFEVLNRSKINRNQISHVLFAGGTCHCDLIRDSIIKEFSHSQSLISPQSQLLTGVGCTLLSARDFTIQLSKAFALRQADRSVCNILPSGCPIAQNTYRVVELLVADVEAPHAIIELGLNGGKETPSNEIISSDDEFQALDCILLAAKSHSWPTGAAEIIKLSVGVDSNLTVTAFAKARISGASQKVSIVGVPLALRIK